VFLASLHPRSSAPASDGRRLAGAYVPSTGPLVYLAAWRRLSCGGSRCASASGMICPFRSSDRSSPDRRIASQPCEARSALVTRRRHDACMWRHGPAARVAARPSISLNCACRVARCPPGSGLFLNPEPASGKLHWGNKPSVAPELLTLLMAERLAFERLHRLRGYPDDVLKAAEDLWREAAEASSAIPRHASVNRSGQITGSLSGFGLPPRHGL
jgi:hypothetical protein